VKYIKNAQKVISWSIRHTHKIWC